MKVPEWAKTASIYEVNVRQYSKEGTLAKVIEALPRIKALGTNLIWLMPIYPICDSLRKCNPKETTPCMGSAYAAYDFKAVNPDFGTTEDLKTLVKTAHDLGIKVILDFVPDHTGWGSKWMKEHPEYFVLKDGKMTAPIDPLTGVATDWSDVAMLDYHNKDLRAAIIDAHLHWIKTCDVDGFREDVAGFVPNDFWAELRIALDAVKPVFMLSEWEVIPEHLTTCFQANYGWTFHALIKDIFKGKKNADSLEHYRTTFKPKYAPEGYQMLYTQNHDENSWNGTERESFGEAADAFSALCFTFDGMPLIYSGQEASLDKRLSFFHKDQIDWNGKSRTAFYKTLNDLKMRNKALHNGLAGGMAQRIETNHATEVYAFVREKDGEKVIGIFNLSAQPLSVVLKGDKSIGGSYKDVMNKDNKIVISETQNLDLQPWQYLILSNR